MLLGLQLFERDLTVVGSQDRICGFVLAFCPGVFVARWRNNNEYCDGRCKIIYANDGQTIELVVWARYSMEVAEKRNEITADYLGVDISLGEA